jgi:hypothetical protein
VVAVLVEDVGEGEADGVEDRLGFTLVLLLVWIVFLVFLRAGVNASRKALEVGVCE